ncbi:MAG: hypothetical protein JHC95_12125 [Solirubrobacteraceae bacterium]|nr:hypothetical protein [Solirubrobacteraceae bacterium]
MAEPGERVICPDCRREVRLVVGRCPECGAAVTGPPPGAPIGDPSPGFVGEIFGSTAGLVAVLLPTAAVIAVLVLIGWEAAVAVLVVAGLGYLALARLP